MANASEHDAGAAVAPVAPPFGRIDRRTWWRIAALALIVRLVFVAIFGVEPIVQAATLVRHMTIARAVVEGHGWRQEHLPGEAIWQTNGDGVQVLRDVARWPPVDQARLTVPTPTDTVGYAALLAATWSVTGSRSLVPVQVIQVLLDCLTAIALGWLVQEVVRDPKLAMLTAILYACSLPAARLAINPHRDGWAVWSGVAVLVGAFAWVRDRRRAGLLVATVAIVVGAWLRPTVAVLALPLVAALLLVPDLPRGRVAAALLACSVALAAGFAWPLVQWNRSNYGRPWALISAMGAWESLGEFPNRHGAVNSDAAAGRRVAELGYTGPVFTLQWDAVLAAEVARIQREEPTLYWRNVGRRLPQFAVSGFADVAAVPESLRMSNYISARPGRSALTFVVDHPGWAMVRFGVAPVFWLLAGVGAVALRKRWRQAAWTLLPAGWAIGYCAITHFENRNVAVGLWGPLVLVAAALLALARAARWTRKRAPVGQAPGQP